MKILILSNTPWDDNNSFGNSFSSIFGGMENIEIANIYCRYGNPNNKIVKRHFQITEKSMLKNLVNSEYPSGKEIVKNEMVDNLSNNEGNVFKHTRKARLQIYFWMRDMIWKVGRWESKELNIFIKDFNPDLIFLPLYYSTYLNDIGFFLKTYSNKKLVTYVSDDIYTLRQFSLSPLYWIDRFIKRRKIKKNVDACEHIYVISEIQRKEYEKIFNKECKLLFKCDDFNGEGFIKEKTIFPLKLIYTGNIGDGRWKSLVKIGRALKKLNANSIKAQLFIYTLTPMTEKMRREMDIKDCVVMMGGVDSSEVKRIQLDADILVHVESLDFKERLQVHHSFSTKIVDYFSRSRCIFAVGTPDQASIDYLIRNDAAIVAMNDKEIYEKLQFLIRKPEMITCYGKKAWDCGKRNHQLKDIQKKLLEDLTRLAK